MGMPGFTAEMSFTRTANSTREVLSSSQGSASAVVMQIGPFEPFGFGEGPTILPPGWDAEPLGPGQEPDYYIDEFDRWWQWFRDAPVTEPEAPLAGEEGLASIEFSIWFAIDALAIAWAYHDISSALAGPAQQPAVSPIQSFRAQTMDSEIRVQAKWELSIRL